jgi:endonuclease YncB( thermonuclease family)
MMVDGKSAPVVVAKDTFGPGQNSVAMYGNMDYSNELRYTCKDVPEGDYYPGLTLTVPWGTYLGLGEMATSQLAIYLNDTRLTWTSHSEPLRPQNAAEKKSYQGELRVDKPIHVKSTDIIRIAMECNGGPCVVGAVRLYGQKPSGSVGELFGNMDDVRTRWLFVQWGLPKTLTPVAGPLTEQSCTFTNPGVLPRTFNLKAQARGYLMAPLMADHEETVTLAPGQTLTKVFRFAPSATGRDRLTLQAESPGVFPPVRKVKYYISDSASIVAGRLGMYLDGKDWEFCYAPGVDPGQSPPANAVWKKVAVPSAQPIQEVRKENGKEIPVAEHHLGWYRKKFKAPQVKGERFVLQCGQVLTEAWVYVNGKFVGHEIHGTQPFEVDITDGYKPGQENELLIAVRDWLAYSPKNQERARKGEPLAVRQDMIDVADYECCASIGITSYIAVAGRAAVAVDDVAVITSVREKKLKLDYRLVNKTGQAQSVTVTPVVWDEGKTVNLNLTPKRVSISAKGTEYVSFEAPWRNAHYWWPEDPHLYALETTVQPAKGAADCHWQRFGFREIWIDGYLFNLNGVKVKIRGNYGAGCMGNGGWMEGSDVAKRLEGTYDYAAEQVLNRGNELNRTHLVPIKAEPAEVADEIGAMVKMEGEVHQVAFTWDNAFWQAALDRDVSLMQIYKNHACVVHWGCGNENMWGLIYLGEKPRDFASAWQLKIAQAVQNTDPMHRPTDWEADGDLFGKWNQHSLHYARDISVYPDVPNSAWWGPWDGKTVAQDYQFGPIILGKKPICLGESFWISPSEPYPQTAVIGDDACKGFNYLSKGWLDSSQWFINGFRDAEFAYIDTLVLSPRTLPHQTVILKEETASFFGGQTLHRGLNVHNDIHTPATFVLRWSLTPAGGQPYVSDSRTLHMDPAGLERLSLDVNLPRVETKTAATWRVELWNAGGLLDRTQERLIHAEERAWHVYPAPEIHVPQGLELSVYDPSGVTADALVKLGVDFVRLSDLAKVSGIALIIGQDALKSAAGGSQIAGQDALTKFVKAGGKVLILAQSKAPEFLPLTLQLAQGSAARPNKKTIAFVRAGDHPILHGLTDEDMRFWAGDHCVSDGTWLKPSKGNYLPLVDVGSGDGMTQSPLMELYDGKGSYILCQMPVVAKATLAPQARTMLENMLSYLGKSECFRRCGRTALVAGPQSPLRAALKEVRLDAKDLGDKFDDLSNDDFEVAIVDVQTALNDGAVATLQAFANGGGRVLLHRGTPQTQELLEKLLGVRLRMMPVENEPNDMQNHVLRMTDSGLLSGISNQELWWMSPKYLAMIRSEGNWQSGYGGGCPPQERIADYYCWPTDEDAGKVIRLTRPGAILQVSLGNGCFVLNQLRLDQAIPEVAPVVQRLRSLLLTNLGCTLKGDTDIAKSRMRRMEQYRFSPIDLSAYANRGLKDDKAAGIVGFANQGENDIRELPVGRQTFAGVTFQIASPKTAVVLYSQSANNTDLPKAVKGIKIGQKADALFFIHTSPYSGQGQMFKYVVHYEDGATEELPIFRDKQTYDWWDDPTSDIDNMAQYNAFIAWTGANPMTKAVKRWGIMLPGWEWANPHPEKAIRDIDFVTTPENLYQPVPCLVAITAATIQGNQGVVTDVIGTRGLKVKMGDQEKEIYYIGVGGIEESHPYYAKAVEAHKAMVLGKTVNIVYDAVQKNNDGQLVAYVYLGSGTSTEDLLNGKVLGVGLARLGDFAGNDRMRTYLMNTGEPAKWRKVGMWAEEKK